MKLLPPRANSPIEALKRSLKDYCVVTLHRPSNVDVSDRLGLICDTLNEVAKTFPLIFRFTREQNNYSRVRKEVLA